MKVNQKIICLSSLLFSISTPVVAATIQCKSVPNTPVMQCVAKGKNASNLYGLANMPYALCSKALCTVDSKNSHKARCTCELYAGGGWRSLSISPSSYAQSKPMWSKSRRLLTVQSNYSMANLANAPQTKTITCQFSKPKPWADCFGVRCKVTGRGSATCMCPVSKNKVFAITGPGSMKKCLTTPNKVWSAIRLKGMGTNSQFVHGLYNKLYPKSPISHSGS